MNDELKFKNFDRKNIKQFEKFFENKYRNLPKFSKINKDCPIPLLFRKNVFYFFGLKILHFQQNFLQLAILRIFFYQNLLIQLCQIR